MRLAFSTNAFTRFGLHDAVTAIADAGFTAVEILADAPHAFPPTMSAADRAQVRQLLDSRSLAVSNVNANCTFAYWKDAPPEPYFEPSLISPNPKHRQARSELILQTLDFAREIGARNISITSGKCLGGMTPALAAAQFAEEIRPILDRADALGVEVGIELEPGLLLEFVTELRHWIGWLNHPRFGANLDIGHSVVNGERMDEAIQTLAGRIWNCHVEDLPGRKHYHQTPGTGTLDWPLLAAALRDIDYQRCVTVELYTQTAHPAVAARASFEFLSRHF
ncbi:MAG: sugar phosphate isomerase/epimerase family protein [Tepidisphaeraceae bacterium]